MHYFFIIFFILFSTRVNAQALLEHNSTEDASTSEVTAPITYYVATTGNDSNPCSLLAPCATIQEAVNKIPGKTIRYPVEINVAAGSYAAGAALSGFVFERPVTPSQGAYLRISGAFQTATIAQGLTEGTVSSVVVGSTKTWGSVTVTGAGWLASDLRGLLLRVVLGTGAVVLLPIEDNTTETITIAGYAREWNVGTVVAAGNTWSLVTPASVITGTITRESGFDSGQLTVRYPGGDASFNISGINQQRDGTSGSIVVEGFRFTSTRAFYINSDASTLVRFCIFTNAGTGLSYVALGRRGEVDLVANYATLANASALIRQLSGNLGLIQRLAMDGNIINGTGTLGDAVETVVVHSLVATRNSIRGVRRAYRVGDVRNLLMQYERWNGCTENCFFGLNAAARGSSGLWAFDAMDIQNFSTTAINIGVGPVFARVDYNVGPSTGSGTGCAFRLGGGAQLRTAATTALTGGASCDFDIETDFGGGTYTYTNLRAATPKVLCSPQASCVVEE